MAKEKKIYICSNCGKKYTRWIGKCSECGEWGTVEEQVSVKASKVHSGADKKISQIKKLKSVNFEQEKQVYPTGINELDRVLGGGFVEKSILLLSGDPGIGKSTLMLQTSNSLIKNGKKVLYISAEESVEQIKKRALRLNSSQEMLITNEDRLRNIEILIKKNDAEFIIIDSIQTIYDRSVDSLAGTISQIKNATIKLREIAHDHNKVILVIGHVTKSGNIAGPKLLEHMVDVVLFFEGERKKHWRILRSHKNRFGSTREIGVFVMRDEGLIEVENPSTFFMENIPQLSGSAMVSIIEGMRPIFLEVQALVSKSFYSMPQRVANGVNLKLLNIILAIIEKRLNYQLGNYDVFLNIVGGFKIKEPAVGLGMAVSIISSFMDKTLKDKSIFIGEVGLSGEIRPVPFIGKRISEAEKIGYKNIFIPKMNYKNKNINIYKSTTLNDMVDIIF